MSSVKDIDPTAICVKSVIVLDADGKRIVVKYFASEWSTVTEQSQFEELLFTKTSRFNARGEAEILLFDEYVVVFKTLGDLTFYVVGDQSENELILANVLYAFHESVNLLLSHALGQSKDMICVMKRIQLYFAKKGWLSCISRHRGHETILGWGSVEKKTALESLDQLLLALDEVIDGGLILEMDPQAVASRVTMKTGDTGFDLNFNEQTFSQALASAKETLARSLMKS